MKQFDRHLVCRFGIEPPFGPLRHAATGAPHQQLKRHFIQSLLMESFGGDLGNGIEVVELQVNVTGSTNGLRM